MSRRQALGVISNVNLGSTSLASSKGQVAKTSASSSASLKTSSSSSSNNNNFFSNDENDPIQNLLKTLKSTSESDFDIFEEEEKVNFGLELIEESENDSVTRKEYIHNYQDEDDEEEEEEDEEEDDDEDDQEEEEDEDYDQELEEEEEGISRLNLAAISSEQQHTFSSKKTCNHDSPMALDEMTISTSIEEDSEISESFTTIQDHDDLDEESLKKKQAEERESLLMNCDEYREDILSYMRKMELENRPKPSYMKKQQDISSSMRSILVDWLVEVSEEYRLNLETLYLAVNYTDRFLSQMSVLRGKLQLVGTASMYVASKYEEITPPDIGEFVYITDDTYTRKQVLRMEHLLLRNLDFKMTTPTTNWFLLYYLRFMNSKTSSTSSPTPNKNKNKQLECLARYIAELSLIDGDTFLNYLPSQIAASAVYLALVTLGKQWTKSIAETLGYKYDLSELKQCINHLHKAMQKAPTHPQQAIQEKYKQAKYESVALIEPPKSLSV